VDLARIDRGIRREVEVLDLAGVETFESCQGGDGHSYPEPTVRFHGTAAAGWHALAVLVAHGMPVRRLSRTWSFCNGAAGEGPEGPSWEVTFYPAT
jgi:hypothetical protein